jgi:hypothetical protein
MRAGMAATLAASVVLLLMPSTAPAQNRDPSARLSCVVLDPDLGEYGELVFEPVRKPTHCTEYVGNQVCHCTEMPLTGIHWHRWGARQATASAMWHYCGSGVCTWRPARLFAYRLRDRCGPAYTRLRIRLPRHRLHGHRQPAYQALIRAPACGGNALD